MKIPSEQTEQITTPPLSHLEIEATNLLKDPQVYLSSQAIESVAPDLVTETEQVDKTPLAHKAALFVGKLIGKSIQEAVPHADGLQEDSFTPESSDDYFGTSTGFAESWAKYAYNKPKSPEADNYFGEVYQVKKVVPAVPEKLIDVTNIVEYGTDVTLREAADRLETQRVVKMAPTLDDIASEPHRTNELSQIVTANTTAGRSAKQFDAIKVQTEHEAAIDFKKFLHTYVETIKASGTTSHSALELVDSANDILENLTFIGESERIEAVKGIAEYWKTFLRKDPEAQLCVLAGASAPDEIKSDKYLLDSILGQFTNVDLTELGPRIFDKKLKLTAEPDKTKIIFIDDWIISGTQMMTTLGATIPDEYRDSVEIQLVTSPKHRIEEGFVLHGYGSDPDRQIPIRSYFMSHNAGIKTRFNDHKAYETGAHSSVDYDFEASFIVHMLDEMGNIASDSSKVPTIMPPLTTIERTYRNSALENIARLHSINAKEPLANNMATVKV